MTPPGPAARHDGAGDHRSPFTGSDVCAAALPLASGGRTVWFDQDVWDFGDVADLAAYLNLCDTRLDFTAITDGRWRLVAKRDMSATPPMMVPTMTGPTPKISVRLVPEALTAARASCWPGGAGHRCGAGRAGCRAMDPTCPRGVAKP